MDAGLAALGQGWPFAAARRINVGLRACRALARDRVVGHRLFGYFWLGRHSGRLPKVTRCKSGTISGRYRNNGYVHKQNSTKDAADSFRYSPPMTLFPSLTDLPRQLRTPQVRDLAWVILAPPMLGETPWPQRHPLSASEWVAKPQQLADFLFSLDQNSSTLDQWLAQVPSSTTPIGSASSQAGTISIPTSNARAIIAP